MFQLTMWAEMTAWLKEYVLLLLYRFKNHLTSCLEKIKINSIKLRKSFLKERPICICRSYKYFFFFGLHQNVNTNRIFLPPILLNLGSLIVLNCLCRWWTHVNICIHICSTFMSIFVCTYVLWYYVWWI